MKLIVNGKTFAASGYVPSEYAPEKCLDWDVDFASAATSGLPESVDLRGYMTPVEDQSQIGSCTANAVAGAYEYLCNRRAMDVGDEAGDISRLFIYYVARKRDQERRGTTHLQVQDSGSTISGAIDALIKKGACLEDTLPYDIANVNVAPSEDMYDEARTYKISGCWQIPTDVNAFKDVLAKGYPIIFGCKLFQSFHSSRGRGGPIPMPSASEQQASEHGLHAMLMVGYSDQHQLFVVRNSWGENWGYGGYCFMPYAYLGSAQYNMGDNWAIRGLTEYDFTPDGEGCQLAFGNEAPEDPPIIEVVHEEEEEEDEEEDDFDVDDFFSDLVEARKVFAVFDEDGSGRIDLTELRDALGLCGQFVTDHFIESVMEEFDENGNDTIEFSEFLELMGIDVPEEEEAAAGTERQTSASATGGGGYGGYGGNSMLYNPGGQVNEEIQDAEAENPNAESLEVADTGAIEICKDEESPVEETGKEEQVTEEETEEEEQAAEDENDEDDDGDGGMFAVMVMSAAGGIARQTGRQVMTAGTKMAKGWLGGAVKTATKTK